MPPGAWPSLGCKGRSCAEHPAPTSSHCPFPGGRNEGGAERDQGPGGVPTGAVLIPAGDLLVKSVPRSPFPDLGSRASASFFRGRGRVGSAGLGGSLSHPGWARVLRRGWCAQFPDAAPRPCRSFCHPRAAAVVVVAMTTRRGFIFNSGPAIRGRPARSPALSSPGAGMCSSCPCSSPLLWPETPVRGPPFASPDLSRPQTRIGRP